METVPEDSASFRGVPLRPDGDEEACGASSGTVSFHDGNRLKTLNLGSEGGKTTLKAQLAAAVAHESEARLKIVAVAAPDNWTFLEKLQPDERVVDFFHACEHLSEVGDRRD